MDTALPQKFPFILDRNLAKANCTGNPVCMSCDTVVLDPDTNVSRYLSSRVIGTPISCLSKNWVSMPLRGMC